MANKPKRVLKKSTETVRQRSEQTNNAKPKRQLVRSSANKAAKPLRAIGRVLTKILRPFAFLLKPFKTKPARFVGRILAKVFLVNYFRNSWKELKQVTWPNRRETWQLTFAVFVFALVFGLVITIVDYGLDKVFEKILLN